MELLDVVASGIVTVINHCRRGRLPESSFPLQRAASHSHRQLHGLKLRCSEAGQGPYRNFTQEENAMAWTTPKIVEVCVGMEVTSYESAEI